MMFVILFFALACMWASGCLFAYSKMNKKYKELNDRYEKARAFSFKLLKQSTKLYNESKALQVDLERMKAANEQLYEKGFSDKAKEILNKRCSFYRN